MKNTESTIQVPLTKNQLITLADALALKQKQSNEVEETLAMFRLEAKFRALAGRQQRLQEQQARVFELALAKNRGGK